MRSRPALQTAMIQSNPVQPNRETSRLPQFPYRPENGEKCLLNNILSIFTVSQHPPGKAEYFLLPGPNNLAESLLVSIEKSSNSFFYSCHSRFPRGADTINGCRFTRESLKKVGRKQYSTHCLLPTAYCHKLLFYSSVR